MIHSHQKSKGMLFPLLFVLIQTSCASIRTQSIPDTTSPLSIGIIDLFDKTKEIKKFDATIELGDTDKTTPSGVFFFPAGRVLVLGTGPSDSAKKDLRNEKEHLTLDPKTEAKGSLLKELSGSTGRFSLNESPGQAGVKVIPGIVLGFLGKDKATLLVSLDAQMKDPDPGFESKEWSCIYIVGVDEPRPISGPKGWTSHQRGAFKKAVAKGFRLAFRTMLDDLDGKLRIENAPKVTVTFPRPFDFKTEPKEGRLLKTTEEGSIILDAPDWSGTPTILFLPKGYPVTPVEPDPKKK